MSAIISFFIRCRAKMIFKFMPSRLLLTMMEGCVVYYPQTADIPLISRKNDLRLDGGVSAMISAHATASYGLTKKVAVQVYGNIYNGHYYQGALGYYKIFDQIYVFEIYGGAGNGYGDAYNDANPGNLKGHYQVYFSQLNFGSNQEGKKSDYGIGWKLGYLHSAFIDQNYHGRYSETGPFILYKDDSFLAEPVAFVRFGGKHLKINLKAGFCWIHQFTHTDKLIPYSQFNLGAGLNYRF